MSELALPAPFDRLLLHFAGCCLSIMVLRCAVYLGIACHLVSLSTLSVSALRGVIFFKIGHLTGVLQG